MRQVLELTAEQTVGCILIGIATALAPRGCLARSYIEVRLVSTDEQTARRYAGILTISRDGIWRLAGVTSLG